MLRLPVRGLAEFVHRRGDLHARLDGRARADEGVLVQQRLQQQRAASYQRERPVALTTTLAGRDVVIAGRMDGCDLDGERILIEEFKATRADAQLAHGHHASVHWAQVRLYAGLLARELGDGRGFHLRLLYCHPDTLETCCFDVNEEASAAADFLAVTLGEYEAWLVRQGAHEVWRDRHIQALAFPFPEFRRFQRAMARRAYRALRDREHLLLEAPTGSGKTAAVLFPAVRALEASGYRRVLFLTSRTTGALAAREAAGRMDPKGAFLRHISLTAKAKACFLPGTPCEPDACRFARGYHDRARDAVLELLERRAIGPDEVAEVARAHQVCPFELSLDTALWCDLVIGDYNYVFDPVVRLQRLAGDADAALLVDESHQLTPRVQDMLSLTFSRREVKDALGEMLPESVARRVRSLDRALLALKRQEGVSAEQAIEHPRALLRSMQRFTAAVATTEYPTESRPATRHLLFVCSRWARCESWYHPERFLFLARAEGRGIVVRLVCIDPGPFIQQRFAEYGGHVRFSGTVSPLALYARLHGEPESPAERAGNPFSPAQLRVLLVDDVPTYLRSRQQSLSRLVALVSRVVHARPGHYLIAFPSFDYLNLAGEAYTTRHPDAEVVLQTPDMDEAARSRFLACFAADAAPRVGFVVLGGVFGESVDFSQARLAGVVCVGVGLPPPTVTRQALQRHFDAQGLDGRAVAYHQPAMVKVLQMAGRLLRRPEDQGVLCLVDPRFRKSAYQRFFPSHWEPELVKAARVADALAKFWQEPGWHPRLRGLAQGVRK